LPFLGFLFSTSLRFCFFLLFSFIPLFNFKKLFSFAFKIDFFFFFWCFVLIRNGEEVDKYQHSETGTRQMTFQSHCILSLQDRQDWFNTALIPLENVFIGTCVVIYMLLISTNLLVIMFLPERFVLYFAFFFKKKNSLSSPYTHKHCFYFTFLVNFSMIKLMVKLSS